MILMPMSLEDFDPTEASIAWKKLQSQGYRFRFATPNGQPARPDPRMMTGNGLGIWKPILNARADAVEACEEMMASEEFQNPIPYESIRPGEYRALLLHGGHAPGMRAYLESDTLQNVAVDFFARNAPVAAICHGVLLLARSIKPDGKSVLHGRKCTTLLKSQEMAAYRMTAAWLGTYYRTYPETTCQQEVMASLASESDFQSGPTPMLRDDEKRLNRGFVVRDGKLLTARWPGDAYRFSGALLEMLQES